MKKEEEKKPHVKKPLNAFMLYMKEMRAKVVAECTLKESAAINQIDPGKEKPADPQRNKIRVRSWNDFSGFELSHVTDTVLLFSSESRAGSQGDSSLGGW